MTYPSALTLVAATCSTLAVLLPPPPAIAQTFSVTSINGPTIPGGSPGSQTFQFNIDNTGGPTREVTEVRLTLSALSGSNLGNLELFLTSPNNDDTLNLKGQFSSDGETTYTNVIFIDGAAGDIDSATDGDARTVITGSFFPEDSFGELTPTISNFAGFDGTLIPENAISTWTLTAFNFDGDDATLGAEPGNARLDIFAIPEPGTLAGTVLAMALGGLALRRRHLRNA